MSKQNQTTIFCANRFSIVYFDIWSLLADEHKIWCSPSSSLLL